MLLVWCIALEEGDAMFKQLWFSDAGEVATYRVTLPCYMCYFWQHKVALTVQPPASNGQRSGHASQWECPDFVVQILCGESRNRYSALCSIVVYDMDLILHIFSISTTYLVRKLYNSHLFCIYIWAICAVPHVLYQFLPHLNGVTFSATFYRTRMTFIHH
jgi:hypothetical protein